MKVDNGVYFNLCNIQTFNKDPNTSSEREIDKKKRRRFLELLYTIAARGYFFISWFYKIHCVSRYIYLDRPGDTNYIQ